jgi:hypothetical protein
MSIVKTMDMAEVKDLNASQGFEWFSPATMRFFKTRLPKLAYRSTSGLHAFFVTSEQDRDYRRRYTVRRCNLQTGRVDTHGDFYSIENPDYARNVAKTEAWSS